jgi:hypothetical protein
MEPPTSGQNVERPATPHVHDDDTPHTHEPAPARGADLTSPMTTASQPTWNDSFSQLDNYAEQLRTKLPAAPPGLIEGYMKFAPWIAIVFGALGFIFSLVLLLFATVLTPLLVLFGGAAGLGYSGSLSLALVVGLVLNALEVVGGYLMLQRRSTGWWLLALGMVISVLSSLFDRSLLVLIVVVLIAYIHLQVKPYYQAK